MSYPGGRNPRHIHTSVRPHEGYLGLAYCYRGASCCSFCEGDYKLPDGSFDVEGARKAALTMNRHALKVRRMLRDTAAFYEEKARALRADSSNPFHVTEGVAR